MTGFSFIAKEINRTISTLLQTAKLFIASVLQQRPLHLSNHSFLKKWDSSWWSST